MYLRYYFLFTIDKSFYFCHNIYQKVIIKLKHIKGGFIMKKLLSILLVISMLITTCVLFTSCNKVTIKNVENKPYETLNNAYKDAMAEFLTDDANIKRAIGGTLKNGAATISLESKSLLGDAGINKISDTIYFDAQNKKYVNDITVNLKDQDIAGRFFVDKNGILISSEDVLNNKNTYGIYPETLAQKFKTSTIASTIFAGQNHDEIQDMLNKFKEAYKEVFEAEETNIEAEFNKLAGLLKQTFTEEKIEKTNYIVATYTISNATVTDLLNAYKDDINKIAEASGEEGDISDLIKDMNESLDFDFAIKVYINAKTALIEKNTISGVLTNKEDDENVTGTINGEITFAPQAINVKLEAKNTSTDESAKFEAVINKTVDGSTVKFDVNIKVSEDDISKEMNPYTYTFNKDSGDFTIKLDLSDIVDDEKAIIVVSGNIKSDNSGAEIVITSVKYDDTTINLNLSIKFEPNKQIPQAPSDVKDVVDMTEDDIMNIMNGITTSKLGKLLGLNQAL